MNLRWGGGGRSGGGARSRARGGQLLHLGGRRLQWLVPWWGRLQRVHSLCGSLLGGLYEDRCNGVLTARAFGSVSLERN